MREERLERLPCCPRGGKRLRRRFSVRVAYISVRFERVGLTDTHPGDEVDEVSVGPERPDHRRRAAAYVREKRETTGREFVRIEQAFSRRVHESSVPVMDERQVRLEKRRRVDAMARVRVVGEQIGISIRKTHPREG